MLRNEGLIEPKDATSQALLDHVRTVLGRSSLGVVDLALEWLPAGDARVLLLVDQFEEVFRYEPASGTSTPRVEDDAAAFVALLLAAAGAGEVAFDVMLTMRADFIGDCIRFEGLPEAISDGQYLVPRLVREQVEEVIRKPVAKASAKIDHDLVEQLLNDNVREPDALPILQHVLMRIWDRADRDAAGTTKSEDGAPGLADVATPFLHRRLTLDHYRSIGLWKDALSRHANEVMDELEAGPDGPAMAIAVQQVFRALTDVDRAGRAIRRAIPFRQLAEETGCTRAQVRAVLDAMRAEGRAFLRPPDGDEVQEDTIVDIGHEALIRRWRKVQDPDVLDERGKPTGWLRDEERDGQAYRSLLEIAEEGERSGNVAILPTDQATSRWDWWSQLERTEAWTSATGASVRRWSTYSGAASMLLPLSAADRRKNGGAKEERQEERRALEERTAKAERDLLETKAREAERREAMAPYHRDRELFPRRACGRSRVGPLLEL